MEIPYITIFYIIGIPLSFVLINKDSANHPFECFAYACFWPLLVIGIWCGFAKIKEEDKNE